MKSISSKTCLPLPSNNAGIFARSWTSYGPEGFTTGGNVLFALQGCTALLRVPEDFYAFCKMLDIPQVEVPNWHAEFHAPGTKPYSSRGEPMEAQEIRFLRHQSPSDTRSIPALMALQHTPSPTKSPQPRRASRDK